MSSVLGIEMSVCRDYKIEKLLLRFEGRNSKHFEIDPFGIEVGLKQREWLAQLETQERLKLGYVESYFEIRGQKP